MDTGFQDQNQQQQVKLIEWFNRKIEPVTNLLVNLKELNVLRLKCDQILLHISIQNKIDLNIDCNEHLNKIGLPNLKNVRRQWICHLIKSIVLKNYQNIWLLAFKKWFQENENNLLESESYMSMEMTSTKAKLMEEIVDKLIPSMVNGKNNNNNTNHELATGIINVILMIFWLDHAKRSNILIPNNPPLFQMVNSSSNVFQKFCLAIFQPERMHRFCYLLKSINIYSLQHKETNIHHLNFKIKNLSTDLADGIRLAKIIQLLFPVRFEFLFFKLKYPIHFPMNRLENVHFIFEQCGPVLMKYDNKFSWTKNNAFAVANYHREETIQLIYSLMRIELAIKIEQNYQPYLNKLILIQRFVKGYLLSKKIRFNYLQLKKYTIFIQQRYRANKLSKLFRNNYIKLKRASIIIQRSYRQYKYSLLLKNYVNAWINNRKNAAITIQRYFRGHLTRNQIIVRHFFYHSKNALKLNNQNRSIGQKTRIILERLSQLKNSALNDNVKFINNNQLISDVKNLYQFCQWCKEIQCQITKWSQLIPVTKCIIYRLNRSEEHRLCANWIVSIFYFTFYDNHFPMDSVYRIQLVYVLMQVTNKYLNDRQLVQRALHFINKTIDSDIAKKLSDDKKWSRLVKKIINHFKISGSNPKRNCEICVSPIQSILISLVSNINSLANN